MALSDWEFEFNKTITHPIPSDRIGRSEEGDAFFTKKDIARECFERLKKVCRQQNINMSNKIFLEPSAGNGSFSDLFAPARSLAMDIAPKKEGMLKADFLKWYPADNETSWVAVGNPPFGQNGVVALEFLNRCLLFADVVGFILPMAFIGGIGSCRTRVQGGL